MKSSYTTKITYEFEFQAAHQLHWHAGQCRLLHGHSYRCELTFAGAVDENGVIVDFDLVAEFVDSTLMARFDHKYLNDEMDNPTAERIAAAILTSVVDAALPVASVRLWETRTSSAIVSLA